MGAIERGGLGDWAAPTDDSGGVAGDDGPGWNIAGDNGAGGDDGTLADGDAGTDEGLGTDPGAIVDGDGEMGEGAVEAGDVVRGGTEEGAVADEDLCADDDGRDGVEIDVAVDDGGGAEGEVPGGPDACRRIDDGIVGEGGAKATEEPTSEAATEEVGPGIEEGDADGEPS